MIFFNRFAVGMTLRPAFPGLHPGLFKFDRFAVIKP